MCNRVDEDDTLLVEITVRNWGLKEENGTEIELWLDFIPILQGNCSQTTEYWANQTKVWTTLPLTLNNQTIRLSIPHIPSRTTTSLLLALDAPMHSALITVEVLQSVPQPGLTRLQGRTAWKAAAASRAWLGAALFALVMAVLVGTALIVRKYRRDHQPLRHIELSDQRVMQF